MELSRLIGWKKSKTKLANYLKKLINGQHWLKATTIQFKGVFQHTWLNVHATSSSIITIRLGNTLNMNNEFNVALILTNCKRMPYKKYFRNSLTVPELWLIF